MGLGKFQLAYLRDKNQNEVDFVVIRDGQPWFLLEVKYREQSMGNGLKYFQDQLNAPFAFQAVVDSEYVDADWFAKPRGPMVVPGKNTSLSTPLICSSLYITIPPAPRRSPGVG